MRRILMYMYSVYYSPVQEFVKNQVKKRWLIYARWNRDQMYANVFIYWSFNVRYFVIYYIPGADDDFDNAPVLGLTTHRVQQVS